MDLLTLGLQGKIGFSRYRLHTDLPSDNTKQILRLISESRSEHLESVGRSLTGGARVVRLICRTGLTSLMGNGNDHDCDDPALPDAVGV